jgi:hypothetical protein
MALREETPYTGICGNTEFYICYVYHEQFMPAASLVKTILYPSFQTNKLLRRKQRSIENLTTSDYAASGGEFNPEWRLNKQGNNDFYQKWLTEPLVEESFG